MPKRSSSGSRDKMTKAPPEVLQTAKQTTELALNVAKLVSHTKPKKVSEQAREQAAITIDLEAEIREKVMKKKKK